MLITYHLFAAFCQLSANGYNVYGMFLCITYLDVIMFVHVYFLSPFIARIALHLICGECFMMFQYSIYQIICLSSELVPEILLSCDRCYLRCLLFLVTMQLVIAIWIVYDLLLWWSLPTPTIVPLVHSHPPSHWTATVDPIENK